MKSYYWSSHKSWYSVSKYKIEGISTKVGIILNNKEVITQNYYTSKAKPIKSFKDIISLINDQNNFINRLIWFTDRDRQLDL